MSFRPAPLALLALLALVVVACGGEAPLRASEAGGDRGTRPAPAATETAAPTEAARATATPTPTVEKPPLSSATFRTPSGRLACATIDRDGGLTLVCDVRPQEGDKGFPKPDATITDACADLAPTEWGNGVALPPSGSAYPNCATDVNVTDQDPPVLVYGATWARDGYTCESAEEGLTCTRGDHRFFANRDVIRTR